MTASVDSLRHHISLPMQVANEFKQSPPIEYLRFLLPPVRHGSVSIIGLESVVAKLRNLLPSTFEELERVRDPRRFLLIFLTDTFVRVVCLSDVFAFA